MGVRSKAFLTVLLVGIVVGVLILQTENQGLFKGQLFGQGDEVTEDQEETSLPDLTVELEFIAPDTEDGDMTIDATIINSGEGEVTGETPFKYTLYVNDDEVFSNTDSYTTMEKGDAFNFTYPIPKTIYNYPETGTLTFTVDTENTILESNEENNQTEIEYSF